MTPLRRWPARARRFGAAVGACLLLLGAGLVWHHGRQPAAPTDAALRAAAALAEVCTTPARLPRRSPVTPRPRRDPFLHAAG
jgi:hypothetical protein